MLEEIRFIYCEKCGKVLSDYEYFFEDKEFMLVSGEYNGRHLEIICLDNKKIKIKKNKFYIDKDLKFIYLFDKGVLKQFDNKGYFFEYTEKNIVLNKDKNYILGDFIEKKCEKK